jgi:hypothetical protein
MYGNFTKLSENDVCIDAGTGLKMCSGGTTLIRLRLGLSIFLLFSIGSVTKPFSAEYELQTRRKGWLNGDEDAETRAKQDHLRFEELQPSLDSAAATGGKLSTPVAGSIAGMF